MELFSDWESDTGVPYVFDVTTKQTNIQSFVTDKKTRLAMNGTLHTKRQVQRQEGLQNKFSKCVVETGG